MGSTITVAEAERLIKETAKFIGTEEVDIDASYGRVLAMDIIAEVDNPPFDRVPLDGIVCRKNAKFPLKMKGCAPAGAKTIDMPEGDDVCLEAMTGAPMPRGAECIVPVEEIIKKDGIVTLKDGVAFDSSRGAHPQGADVRKGDVVLKKGHTIKAPVVAALAANGFSKVLVAKSPVVRILATGDELVSVDSKLLEDGQVRRSNDRMIESVFKSFGCTDIKRHYVKDGQKETEEAIKRCLDECDILVMSGGVSLGNFDYVPESLMKMGVEKVFHHVLQRPGAPFMFGKTAKGQAVFALPGNPVASLSVSTRYVGGYIKEIQGAADKAVPTVRLEKNPKPHEDRERFFCVKLNSDRMGYAMPIQTPSGDFQKVAIADGIVEIPSLKAIEEGAKYSVDGKDQEVRFYSW